jgi:hypothetical protein
MANTKIIRFSLRSRLMKLSKHTAENLKRNMATSASPLLSPGFWIIDQWKFSLQSTKFKVKYQWETVYFFFSRSQQAWAPRWCPQVNLTPIMELIRSGWRCSFWSLKLSTEFGISQECSGFNKPGLAMKFICKFSTSSKICFTDGMKTIIITTSLTNQIRNQSTNIQTPKKPWLLMTWKIFLKMSLSPNNSKPFSLCWPCKTLLWILAIILIRSLSLTSCAWSRRIFYQTYVAIAISRTWAKIVDCLSTRFLEFLT